MPVMAREGVAMSNWIWTGVLCLAFAGTAAAKETTMIKLPAPDMQGGKPLMQALKERHSTREFSVKPLPQQMLANLLWAATGVNRAQTGQRTAPSARDWREIDVYVATADGVFLYAPDEHALRPVFKGDIRARTGVQDFVATAPVNLVYVANLDRMTGSDAENRALYGATDTGFIAQNVYLYCASAGLGTVVRGSIDRDALGAALGLGPHQKIILAQSVGYPKSEGQ
jgi:SagB-type dehydrogenase family enzyme